MVNIKSYWSPNRRMTCHLWDIYQRQNQTFWMGWGRGVGGENPKSLRLRRLLLLKLFVVVFAKSIEFHGVDTFILFTQNSLPNPWNPSLGPSCISFPWKTTLPSQLNPSDLRSLRRAKVKSPPPVGKNLRKLTSVVCTASYIASYLFYVGLIRPPY